MLNESAIKNFEEHAKDLIEESMIPGAAIGVLQNSKLVYEKGFGYRDVEKQLEANIDTVFCIGSITKSFTCISLMQLQEAGKLSINDSVTKYLPELRIKNSDATNHMTLHHFMTHSSGMPTMPFMVNSMFRDINEDLTDDQITLKILTDDDEPMTAEELMDKISQLDIEPLAPPGTIFSYSNECFCLLGAVIERVSGIPYEKYVKENILNPAGMEHSSFFFEDLVGYENITHPYVLRNQQGIKDVIVSPKWWNPPAMRATGLLNSTVRDMLRYTEIYRNGGIVGTERILTSESIKQMTTPYIETNMVPGQYYGYGLMLTSDYYGTSLIEHTGGGKGVTAKMKILPEKGLAAVGLSNLYMSLLPGIVDSAINMIEDRPLRSSRFDGKVQKIPVDCLNEYAGHYLSGDRGVIPVDLRNDSLTISAPGATYILEGLDKDIFKVKTRGMDESVRFFRDENNQLNKMSLNGRILTKMRSFSK